MHVLPFSVLLNIKFDGECFKGKQCALDMIYRYNCHSASSLQWVSAVTTFAKVKGVFGLKMA